METAAAEIIDKQFDAVGLDYSRPHIDKLSVYVPGSGGLGGRTIAYASVQALP